MKAHIEKVCIYTDDIDPELIAEITAFEDGWTLTIKEQILSSEDIEKILKAFRKLEKTKGEL